MHVGIFKYYLCSLFRGNRSTKIEKPIMFRLNTIQGKTKMLRNGDNMSLFEHPKQQERILRTKQSLSETEINAITTNEPLDHHHYWTPPQNNSVIHKSAQLYIYIFFVYCWFYFTYLFYYELLSLESERWMVRFIILRLIWRRLICQVLISRFQKCLVCGYFMVYIYGNKDIRLLST